MHFGGVYCNELTANASKITDIGSGTQTPGIYDPVEFLRLTICFTIAESDSLWLDLVDIGMGVPIGNKDVERRFEGAHQLSIVYLSFGYQVQTTCESSRQIGLET